MTNKVVLAAVLFVVVASIVAWQWYTNLPEQLYGQALALAEQGQYAEAVVTLERIANNPTYANQVRAVLPQIYLDWGKQLEAERNYDLAIEKYQLILDKFPDSTLVNQAREAIERAEVAIAVNEIAKLPDEEKGELPPPSGFVVAGLGDPVLIVENGTEYVLTVRYKGPLVIQLVLQPNEVTEITLRPGIYEVAATVSDPSVMPFYGRATFETDRMYETFFYIETVSWP